MIRSPNQRLHANAAITLLFHPGRQWRGVGEPDRWASPSHYEMLALRE
jgi:hypothetical protein